MRCNDEFAFHIVKLTNHKGKTKNHNVFSLWKEVFDNLKDHLFKGSLKNKYGKDAN